MNMTVGELIAALEDMRDSSEQGNEMEVRIAYQPNYPLAATVVGVADSREFEGNEDGPAVAWIATGEVGWGESPYASAEAWNAAYSY
jgi:hypothetical protein